MKSIEYKTVMQYFSHPDVKELVETHLGTPIKLTIDEVKRIVLVQGPRGGREWDLDDMVNDLLGPPSN